MVHLDFLPLLLVPVCAVLALLIAALELLNVQQATLSVESCHRLHDLHRTLVMALAHQELRALVERKQNEAREERAH